MEKHVQAALIILEIYWIEYFKIAFLNNHNCVYKTSFTNSVTYYMYVVIWVIWTHTHTHTHTYIYVYYVYTYIRTYVYTLSNIVIIWHLQVFQRQYGGAIATDNNDRTSIGKRSFLEELISVPGHSCQIVLLSYDLKERQLFFCCLQKFLWLLQNARNSKYFPPSTLLKTCYICTWLYLGNKYIVKIIWTWKL